MVKILHIITRLDMGGSAQNTLLSCKKLSGKYETILFHGSLLNPEWQTTRSKLFQRVLKR
jgi:hypothetical protein